MKTITRQGQDAQTTTANPRCPHLLLRSYRDRREGPTWASAMSKWDRLQGTPRTLLGYAVAVIAVGAAAIATLALGPAMKHTPTLFFCAVMLASWCGGVGPGILAGLLSALALDYYTHSQDG
jgi:uncharacterized membrane protein YbhN (UPF0104 family)